MVTLDLGQCRAVAQLLRDTRIPEDREDTSLPEIPRERLPDLLFLVVAICHQTSPASGERPLEGLIDGREARGWDYLLRRLASAAAQDPLWTDPHLWPHCDRYALEKAMRDDAGGGYLTDTEGRAALIRDLGQTMAAAGWRRVSDTWRASGGWIKAHKPNLVDELARFRAYRDPVRKKTYYFLSLMRNFGLWEYADPENLGPPADYHEVRGHLRMGTVVVRNLALLDRLIQRKPVSIEEDNAIRAAVVEAIELIARNAGVTPSRAHYLFWNIFRNICTRANPQCFEVLPGNPLPERYVHLTALAPSGRGCPFASVCLHAGCTVMPQDPVVVTEFH